MDACGAGIHIEAVKTRVALNLKQMAVTTNEDIRVGFH